MEKISRMTTLFRWLLPVAALGFAILIFSHAGDAQAPAQTPSAYRTMSPLTIDPQGAEDPAVTFERWRRENRVTTMAPRRVIEAHRKWLQFHRAATPSPTAAAPASHSSPEQSFVTQPLSVIAGTNVDLGNVLDYQGEVAIAIDPSDPNRLVAGANTFFTDSHCPAPGGSAETQALFGSTDGGATWTYACAPWPAGLNQGSGPIFFGSDPAVTWDATGNAYAAYLLISEDNAGDVSSAVEVAKSTDSGMSWAPFGTV